MSDSLRPHESQHARPPCPSPTPRVHSNPSPLRQWCHPAISSSVVPFSSCPQSLPASGSFLMSQLFAWGGQSIGVSASAYVIRCCMLAAQSCLTLCTPWTVAHQAPLSVEFSRQEYWGGLPFPSPVHLPNPGIEPESPTLQADSLPSEPPGASWWTPANWAPAIKLSHLTQGIVGSIRLCEMESYCTA